MSTPLTPVITEFWDRPDLYTLDGYRAVGGYRALERALTMDPDDIIAQVKESGLRGRGGAGFPTGMKWGFVPQGDGKPHYLVVNADESEPGACKDIPIMMANPHALVEGVIISSFAIRANHAFIYIRGEVPNAIRSVQLRIREKLGQLYALSPIEKIGRVRVTDEPVRPRKKRAITILTFLGLVGGVAGAYVFDYLWTHRRRIFHD